MNLLGRWNLVTYLIDHYQLTGWKSILTVIGGLLLCMAVPYLLGSLNFGVIISRAKFGDDVRTHGSGNAGTTNMLRTYGKGAAVLTMAGDMLKAVVAVAFGYLVWSVTAPTGTDSVILLDRPGAAIAGLFVMLGHMFPCYFRFKGGKGVATLAMVVLMINPIVFGILLLIFIIIVAFTKYVSLGSVMGSLLYPIILYAFKGKSGLDPTACALAVVMGLLVTYMHRENLKRLKDGKESKLSFKKKKPEEAKPAEAPAPEEKEPEKEYQFVHCTGCGRLIPQSRQVCGYCSTVNANYVPDPDEADGKKKKKKQK